MGPLKTISQILVLALFFVPPARAQTAGVTLSGHVTGPSQSVIAHASVSLKNAVTGESTQVDTDPSGSFTFVNVAPGTYELSVSARGFQTKTDTLILLPAVGRTVDVMLTPESSQLSLEDLGISEAEAKGNPQVQAMLASDRVCSRSISGSVW